MEDNALLEAALGYASLGYPVFPCRPGRKLPLTQHGRNDASTDEATIRAWWEANPRANVGLVTDGLLVVDVDGSDNAWPADQELAVDLVAAPTSVTPSGGRHHVFRQPAGRGWRSTAGRVASKVDTRADGGYIVVSPSVLEDGGQYQWIDGLELDTPREALGEPPAWLVGMLDQLAAGRGPGKLPTSQVILGDSNPIPDGQRNATLARLAGTMRRAGMSRGEIGSALHRCNQDRCVPPLCESEVDRIAESISRYEPDQITVALVENHWGQMVGEAPPVIGGPVDPGPFPHHLLEVDGFLGMVCETILANSHRPQPILALGASLSLLSVVAGRKVRDEIDTRPNLYSIGVAPSGGGKEAARRVIKDLLYLAGAGDRVGEGIASHAGLVTAVAQAPSSIWLLDEVGRWFRSVGTGAANAAPHLMGIVTNLLKLYSSSNTVFLGDCYADPSKKVSVNQPNVVMYGTTVPQSLYEGLNAESITDGLLARVMVWEAPATRPPKQKPQADPPSPSLVNLIREWLAWVPGSGNLANENPQPYTVRATPEAAAILDAMDETADARLDELGDPLGTLWTRAAEKARKLALLRACSSTIYPGRAGFEIDERAAQWACELATWATERMIYLAHQWVSDGAFDCKRKRVLRAIEASGKDGLTGSELCRRTQSLSPRERQEVLEALVQSGEINLSISDSNRPGRNATRYFAAKVGVNRAPTLIQ